MQEFRALKIQKNRKVHFVAENNKPDRRYAVRQLTLRQKMFVPVRRVLTWQSGRKPKNKCSSLKRCAKYGSTAAERSESTIVAVAEATVFQLI
jgi:hypothetical protein